MSYQLHYTKIADFTNDVPEHLQGLLTSDVANDNTINTSIIEQALIWAEQRIDSKLAERNEYKLPVRTEDDLVPRTIVDAVHAFALWKLFGRRTQTPDDITQRFDEARDWIDDISKRRASLPVITAQGKVEDRPKTRPIIDQSRITFDKFNFR